MELFRRVAIHDAVLLCNIIYFIAKSQYLKLRKFLRDVLTDTNLRPGVNFLCVSAVFMSVNQHVVFNL